MRIRLWCLGLVGWLSIQFGVTLNAQQRSEGPGHRYDLLFADQKVMLFDQFEQAVQLAASASSLSPQLADAILRDFKTENVRRLVAGPELRAHLLEMLYQREIPYPVAKEFLWALRDHLRSFTMLVDTGFLGSVKQVNLEGKVIPKIGKDRGVTPPRALLQPLPRYTEVARKFGIEGLVLLEGTVLEDGSVANLKVVRGLGYGLDESAIFTIQDTWNFQPATRDGMAVPAQANIEISFRLY